MIFGLGFSLSELPAFQASCHCCSAYGVAIPFSYFNPFPTSFTEVLEQTPMFGYQYMYLSQLVLVEHFKG